MESRLEPGKHSGLLVAAGILIGAGLLAGFVDGILFHENPSVASHGNKHLSSH